MEKVLVLFPGALGDFILFLPALIRIAREKKVDLLARSEYAALLPPHIEARSLDGSKVSHLFVRSAAADRELRRFLASYQGVYSWMGSRDPLFVQNLKELSAGKAKVYPFPIRPRIHAMDYYLKCVVVGESRMELPELSLKAHALDWSLGFWEEKGLKGKSVLVLAPGSGAKEKNWPIEYYLRVAEWWEVKVGRAVFVLGPVEEERSGDLFRHSILTVSGLDLAKLAALLLRSDLYLGNDSGVTHLAAALGVETVALFGPTDTLEWAPRGKGVTLITKNVECSPCLPEAMKSCPHRKCLRSLDPSQVIGSLEILLK